MKSEQVTINLGNPENPPINIVNLKNENPTRNNFLFIPKYNPILSEYIDVVSWDCVAKSLIVQTRETPTFEVFSWFSTINDRHSEMQKSAFSDMEQDAIILTFLDSDKKEVVKFKFKCIRLTKHNLSMISSFPDECLTHQISLSYQDFSRIEEKESNYIDETDTDREWTTYVAPQR